MTAVVLRADASASVGTGHVMRCLALAQAVAAAGGRAVLAVAECPEPLVERARGAGVHVERLDAEVGSADDVAATLEVAASVGAPWVLLDGYRFGLDVQRALRGGGRRVALVDDFGHLDGYDVDLLLNQNSHAEASAYPGVPTCLVGPRYALLRPEFVRAVEGRPAARVDGPARRVLVTMGGSDPGNATTRVLKALARVPSEGLEIRAVVGAANPHGAQVAAAAAALDRCEVIAPVEDMVPLLDWADLAVCAGGSTLWEMAALGVPVACVVVADNQAPIAVDLERRGMVAHLGWDRDLEPEACARTLAALLSDGERRAAMAAVGRGLVDGRGAARVAAALGAGSAS